MTNCITNYYKQLYWVVNSPVSASNGLANSVNKQTATLGSDFFSFFFSNEAVWWLLCCTLDSEQCQHTSQLTDCVQDGVYDTAARSKTVLKKNQNMLQRVKNELNSCKN